MGALPSLKLIYDRLPTCRAHVVVRLSLSAALCRLTLSWTHVVVRLGDSRNPAWLLGDLTGPELSLSFPWRTVGVASKLVELFLEVLVLPLLVPNQLLKAPNLGGKLTSPVLEVLDPLQRGWFVAVWPS